MVNPQSLEKKKKEILSNLNESDLKQYLVLLSIIKRLKKMTLRNLIQI